MNIERTTLEERAARHAALADVARLMVVEELALGDRSPASSRRSSACQSNLLAHHLKVLEDAGLVARRRSEGDRRRTYLTLLDSSLVEQTAADPQHVSRVLFVCSANSARSQLAAALWRRTSDIPVASAGTRPAERVSDGAKAVAKRRSLKLVGSKPTCCPTSPPLTTTSSRSATTPTRSSARPSRSTGPCPIRSPRATTGVRPRLRRAGSAHHEPCATPDRVLTAGTSASRTTPWMAALPSVRRSSSGFSTPRRTE